jgi:hypothetical protein
LRGDELGHCIHDLGCDDRRRRARGLDRAAVRCLLAERRADALGCRFDGSFAIGAHLAAITTASAATATAAGVTLAGFTDLAGLGWRSGLDVGLIVAGHGQIGGEFTVAIHRARCTAIASTATTAATATGLALAGFGAFCAFGGLLRALDG